MKAGRDTPSCGPQPSLRYAQFATCSEKIPLSRAGADYGKEATVFPLLMAYKAAHTT